MPDDGEKFPLSERILQAFTALSHWARIGESGCGNPLTWVKVVVLLLVVVLCPLFFLPIVLVRLAHTGRTGFRYGVAIRTTNGAAARLGRGVLPPLPDPAELMAMIAPGAEGQAAMAAATSLSSLAGSFGQAMGQRMDGAPAGLDWLSWDGQYDLAFTRPAGSRTDPSAALASRTCAACGRAYRSELATACEYCKAERPTPWGQWRLANVTVVDE